MIEKDLLLLELVNTSPMVTKIRSLPGSEKFKAYIKLLAELTRDNLSFMDIFNTLKEWKQNKIKTMDSFTTILRVYLHLFYMDNLVEDLKNIVRFKTYRTDVPNYLNPEIIQLGKFLQTRSESLGLKFKNYDNLAFEFRLGIGSIPIGFYAHCDVVPAEEKNWKHPPFEGVQFKNKIYGRGTVDNKSPIISLMYVMKVMKDTGIPWEHEPVMVVGTSEETSWDGINHYLRQVELPSINLVLDNKFPVVYAEKGVTNIHVTHPVSALFEFDRSPYILIDISGGTVPNQVPAHAECILGVVTDEITTGMGYVEKSLKKYSKISRNCFLKVFQEGNNLKLVSTGKAAHGSIPGKGNNAIWGLVNFLVEELRVSGGPEIHLLQFISENICFDIHGEKLGLAYSDPDLGSLTVNMGTLQRKDNTLETVLNIRYPRGKKWSNLVDSLERTLKKYNDKRHAQLNLYSNDGMDAIYMSPGSSLVRQLMKIYKEITGRDDPAITGDGTTYAKVIPDSVGFGPCLPGSPDCAHTDNEYITLEELALMTGIYLTTALNLRL